MSEPLHHPPPGRDREQPDLLVPQTVLSRIAVTRAEFEGVFSMQTVERYVVESSTALHRSATVTTHLTALAQRFATDRLTGLAPSRGHAPKDVPEVLFLCVPDAGRSQMAAALLTHRGAGRVHVRSAGSAPASSINPAVVEAMAELGLDLGQEFPKPLTDDVVAAADCVVTMGCGDACPIYPGKTYLDWALTDPDGADLETVRRIRDDLDTRVRVLLRELTDPTPTRSEVAAATGSSTV